MSLSFHASPLGGQEQIACEDFEIGLNVEIRTLHFTVVAS